MTASIDRNRISIDDSFTLNIFSDSIIGNLNPDLQPLNTNFQVVNQFTSSEVVFINGNQTSKQQLTLVLMPKHSGHLMIPALTIGKDHTQALYIDVMPASAIPQNQKELFIEANIDPKDSYPQAQNIYTVKLFAALSNLSGSLSIPTADGLRFEPLGKQIDYQTKRGTRIFSVAERRYAVIAEHAGNFTIPPVTFVGSANTVTNGNVLFELTGGKPVRALSPTVKLTIKPALGDANEWLPAQQVSLNETWSPNPPTFKVGEPVTRTITLSTIGLAAKQLPDINMPTLNGINSYPEQPMVQTDNTRDGLIGNKTYKIAYIPTQSGQINFPAVTIRWWNTNTKQFATATLPAQQFSVAPSLITQPTTTQPITPSPAIVATPIPSRNNLWIALAGLFFAAWLVTSYLLWKRKKKSSPGKKSKQLPPLHL